jgi:hypothetical protein
MDEFETRLHRTWLSILLEGNYREVAALVVDADLLVLHGSFEPYSIRIDLPSSAFIFVTKEPTIRQVVEDTLRFTAQGHLYDQNGNNLENIAIEFRVRLLEVEDNWRNVIKELIVNAKDANQGVVTEKVFSREKKQVFLYNEMKFASQAEIRVAQELERRQVLFFPLPLAVRSDTGKLFIDHREVDFLICQDGVWGILEVSYHPDRYEKDSEKDIWFKKSGILYIQHYTTEKCYSQSSVVVDEFLNILKKYKR